MKKLFGSLMIVMLLLMSFPVAVKADMGPKPSIVITFEEMGEPYYVTLLSAEKDLGPWDAYEGEDADRYFSSTYEKQAFQRFVEYAQNDDYYFMMYWDECTETNEFRWTYYPPKDFKVLIYLAESDRLIATDTYETYAFDSYYRYDAATNTLVENYDHTMETVNLVIRVVLTILIEVGIALLFGMKDFIKPIVITNIITQLLLNLYINLTNYYAGLLTLVLTVFVVELAVIIIEAIVYKIIIKKRAITYAIVANIVSFAVGLLLAAWIPGMF